jgi:hypothetical protein
MQNYTDRMPKAEFADMQIYQLAQMQRCRYAEFAEMLQADDRKLTRAMFHIPQGLGDWGARGTGEPMGTAWGTGELWN